MKALTQRACVLAAGLAGAETALAHPGDHAASPVAANIAHFLTDPWHAGFALVASLAVAALLWQRRKDRGTDS